MISRNPACPALRTVSGQYHATDPSTAFTCTVLWGEGHAAIFDDKPEPVGMIQMALMPAPIEEIVAPYRERLNRLEGHTLNLEMPLIMTLVAKMRLMDRAGSKVAA